MGEGNRRVRLQEEVFAAWEKELQALGLEGGPSLGRRKKALLEEILSFPSPSPGDPRRLARRAREAGAVLVGDYHTLPRAQRSAGRILAALVHEGASPLLFLECFSRRDAKALGRWNQGRSGLERLRRETRFDRDWGFPWEGYAELLEKARRLRVPVHPLEEARTLRGMKRRERAMARMVERACRSRPGRLPFLLAGDLHLAREGLPSLLEAAGRIPFRVFQNQEALYWKLAGRGGLRAEAWVELDRWTWCLLETHPLWKLQSAFAWLEDTALAGDSGPDPDLSEKILELAGALSRWLGIPFPGERAPLVFSGDPLSFLDLLEGLEIPLPPAREFLREVTAARVFLPAGKDLLYLAWPALNTMAEGAARWLREAVREEPSPGPTRVMEAFLEKVLEHALGWTGSLLFNPFRVSRGKPGSTRRFWKCLDRGPVGLQALEEKVRQVKAASRPQLARRLGEQLGTALFSSVEKGTLSKAALREVFLAPPRKDGGRGIFLLLSSLVRAPGLREGLGERVTPEAPGTPGPGLLPSLLHPED